VVRGWWAALGVAALAAGATYLPICDALFDCGCRWFFLGGAAHCNIHHAGPPHCPVCADRLVGAAFSAGLYGAWTALVRLAQRLLPP
jgi:hypothetical protein